MEKKHLRSFFMAGILAVLSVMFTLLTRLVDVQPIGPQGSAIGFAGLNRFVHSLFGVHMLWYHITDWLGLIPVFSAFLFAAVGLVQLIRRKSLFRVDRSILILGGYYVVTMALYIFFEVFIVNYRPILMEGRLEASYPSSHTLMTVCLMLAAVTECKLLIRSKTINRMIQIFSYGVVTVTVIGRLISGVHWFTDIVGGLLFSCTLVMLHRSVLSAVTLRQDAGRS
ncbi:phosphatase PAP2 family protein [Ruminococcus sp.]|uniref:phosphatase PAP2 family protein n=1 Tax=Ruminococcus sp. TaxID=41978 RepID=UPI003F0CD91E